MNSFFKYLGMVAFPLLPVLSSAALQSGKVEVGKTNGTVTLIDAKSQRKPLASGAVFQEGTRVETGADSSVELVFSNGSSVVLTPNTLLEVRTFRQIASAGITSPYSKMEKDPSPSVTELEVSRGKIIGEARKLAPFPYSLLRLLPAWCASEARSSPWNIASARMVSVCLLYTSPSPRD
jgi:hypothetical protein